MLAALDIAAPPPPPHSGLLSTHCATVCQLLIPLPLLQPPLHVFHEKSLELPISSFLFSWQLGASLAVGVDIDELAVSAASHNAGLNGLRVGHDFTALLPGVDEAMGPRICNAVTEMEGGKGFDNEFDIVVANILVNPLVELAPSLATWTKTGGIIGLSGVLTSQVGLHGVVQYVFHAHQCIHNHICLSFSYCFLCVGGCSGASVFKLGPSTRSV